MVRVGIAKAKGLLSELVNRVAYGGERVILESRGKPKAALISLEMLQQLEEMERKTDAYRQRKERQAALASADAVRKRILKESEEPLSDSVKDLELLRYARLKKLAKSSR